MGSQDPDTEYGRGGFDDLYNDPLMTASIATTSLVRPGMWPKSAAEMSWHVVQGDGSAESAVWGASETDMSDRQVRRARSLARGQNGAYGAVAYGSPYPYTLRRAAGDWTNP